MTRYTVQFSEEAWEAVRAQIRYLTIEKKAPLNASRWSARLYDAIDTPEFMPRRFGFDQLQTDAAGTDVHRMAFEQTYLVYSTFDDDGRRVHVLSFRGGARSDDGEDGAELP